MVVGYSIINKARPSTAGSSDGSPFAAPGKGSNNRTDGGSSGYDLDGMCFRPPAAATLRIGIIFRLLRDAARPGLKLLDFARLADVDRARAGGVIAVSRIDGRRCCELIGTLWVGCLILGSYWKGVCRCS